MATKQQLLEQACELLVQAYESAEIVTGGAVSWGEVDLALERALVALAAEDPPKRLVVVLEGGLLRGAVSDHPELFLDASLALVDYDTEGSDAPLIRVPQGPTQPLEVCDTEALGALILVEKAGINVEAVFSQLSL